MKPPTEIRRILRRAVKRLRMQRALDRLTAVLILALPVWLVLLWLGRMEWISPNQLLVWSVFPFAACVWGFVSGWLRNLPDSHVAMTVDESSQLQSRFSSAVDFEKRLAFENALPPETTALMRLAISDTQRFVDTVDLKQSIPFRAPRDGNAAIFMGALAIFVLFLGFPPPDVGQAIPGAAIKEIKPNPDVFELQEEDSVFVRELLEEMKKQAQESNDPELQKIAQKMEALLNEAKSGKRTKEDLLAELDKLEREYTDRVDAAIDRSIKDMESIAKPLQKSKETRELSKALETGDLSKVQDELSKLAQKIEQAKLSEGQKDQMAKAMEKAAKLLARKQKTRDQEQDLALNKQKSKVQRLKKQAETSPQNQALKRRLRREERKLQRLAREREKRQKHAPKRRLARLHRRLQDAAESLASRSPRESAQRLREFEDEIRDLQRDQQQNQNRKNNRSQLADLKEALRRARRKKNSGKKKTGRQRRLADFRRRAQGQRGNRQMWRNQSSRQRLTRGGQQGQKGGSGKKGGGTQYGDQHDPDLLGDETDRLGQTQDEQIRGKHGAGTSRKQTILSSANRGFASASYRKVFADYKKIVEEVMSQEDVPQGYKYYVKKYFQQIKPRSENQ